MTLTSILLLSLVPAAAMVCGAALSTTFEPGPRLRSAVQHLAAGLVLGAVAVELVPELGIAQHATAVTLGFAAGVAVMFALAWAFESRGSASVSGLLASVGVDAALDGLLLGLALAVTAAAAEVLLLALGAELLFLALATQATLRARGMVQRRAALNVAGLGLAVPLGAVLGAAAIASAAPVVVSAVLAFGVAALLYLVVEELLADAHKDACTPHAALLFFAGFLVVLVAKALI